MKYKFTILLSGLLYIISVNTTVFAGGSDLSLAAGSQSISLNGLYFAGPNGIQSTVSNPAGLTYLNGYGAEIFILDRMGEQEYNSHSQGMFRSFREDAFSTGGGAYWNISQNYIIAVAYNPVINYDVNWPFTILRRKPGTSNVLAFDMFNRIMINSITPSIAVRFGDVSFGLSGNLYMIEQDMGFPISNEGWFAGVGQASYQLSYEQNGWAYGFTAGVKASLSGKLKAGASLRSGYTSTLEGTAKSRLLQEIDLTGNNSDISSEFQMPWSFGAGIIYSLNDSWNLNIDAAYNLWNAVQENLIVEFSNPLWQRRLSIVDSVTGIKGNNFPLQLENSLDIGLGIEYTPAAGLIYRAGYKYSQSPNSSETYSMFFPVVDQHLLSAGIGYRENNLSIDAALAYTFGISNEVTRTGEPFASGKYNSNAFIPSITISYRF